MKKIVLLFCHFLMVLLVCGSCSEHENIASQDNNGNIGTLSYEWSSFQVNDTIYLVCSETIRYRGDDGSHVINPKATVKLWPEKKYISFAQNTDPTPVYLKSDINSGYDGLAPRSRSTLQKLQFDDGQTIMAEIKSELYTYVNKGRELFYPHVELQELMFSKVNVENKQTHADLMITFDIPWIATDGSGQGKKELCISYIKEPIADKDQLLSISYSKSIEWLGENLFRLMVKKQENWKIAGTKPSEKISPDLYFNFSSSESRVSDVSNFDFDGRLAYSATIKQDIENTEWKIKKGMATQTIQFSNGTDYLENNFSYPIYDAYLSWDGKVFNFDLSVRFAGEYHVAKLNNDAARLFTIGSAILADHCIEKTVAISLIKKTDASDDEPISKYGKILGCSVSAVFDQSELSSKQITKKCVLIHYEKGYEWGICEYDEAFPKTFNFSQSDYNAFNSAAKYFDDDCFQLARAVDSDNNISWYNSRNDKISAINVLTCKFYGWKNIVNGKYVSEINSYISEICDDGYTIKLTAPDGTQKTFSSLP